MNRHLLSCFCILWMTRVAVAGEAWVGDAVSLREAFATAGPGDVVLIEPGTYPATLLRGGGGTREAPVVLRAAEPDRPPLFGGGRSEGLHLVGVSYVELRDLIITSESSNAVNIDDGGDRERPARGIRLTNLVVRGATSEGGNLDGIKLSGVDGFTIAGCSVAGWGGHGCGIDMVGCHDGVITDSLLHGHGTANNGIQAKGGSSHITIRRSLILGFIERGVNLGGSTGAAYFRPPTFAGFEATDLLVEGCIFWGGNTPVAFVSSRDCTFRYNMVLYPQAWAVRILRENRMEGSQPTRAGTYAQNLIVWRRGELRKAMNIGSGTAAHTFSFEHNRWYCTNGYPRGEQMFPSMGDD